jgi:hypothetical protein
MRSCGHNEAGRQHEVERAVFRDPALSVQLRSYGFVGAKRRTVSGNSIFHSFAKLALPQPIEARAKEVQSRLIGVGPLLRGMDSLTTNPTCEQRGRVGAQPGAMGSAWLS